MPRIKLENAERGALAEAVFGQWLDASPLPYIYVFRFISRGALKRPDYLVALPLVGALALTRRTRPSKAAAPTCST